jgi:hypothetical protein
MLGMQENRRIDYIFQKFHIHIVVRFVSSNVASLPSEEVVERTVRSRAKWSSQQIGCYFNS